MQYFPLFCLLLAGAPLAQGPVSQSVRTLPTSVRNAPAALPTPTGLGTPQPDHVVFDQPRAEAPLWALGRTWKGSFDATGFTYIPFFGSDAPRNFPLRVELQRATLGGEPLPLLAGQPERRDQQVRTARGSLVEVFDTDLGSVEQSFVFERLPSRGAIVVDVALSGEFTTASTDAGLTFATPHGTVGYQKALARDAAGRELPLPIAWVDGCARIEIPAPFVASAALPLVLDPLLQTTGLAPGWPSFRAQRYPDVDQVAATSTAAIVWTRQWSATDEDAVIQRLDASLHPIGGEQYLDFTSDSWIGPRVAGNEGNGAFLAVAEVDQGSAAWIAGRLLDQNGVLGPVIDIERDGVVGLPGRNFRPDVGRHHFATGGFLVVFEHETAVANRDIYTQRVASDGTVAPALPVAVETGAADAQNPAIASSPGDSFTSMIVWQQTSAVAPFDDDIWGAATSFLSWVPFPIATTTRPERRPCVSSAANVIGTHTFAVAYEDDYGTDRDIVVALLDVAGAAVAPPLALNQAEAGSTYLLRNQIFPTVDTDGNRFTIGYSEYSGTDYDTYVTTVAWLPSTSSWRLDDERIALGATVGSDDYWTRMVARWNFTNNLPSADYTIVGANILTNEIEVRTYGGYRSGPPFVVFGSQCGNLPITTTGVPVTGTYVTFRLTTTGPLAGFVFGFPGYQPIGICPCVLAVSNGVTVPGPNYTWYVPADPIFVNSFLLSVQGWAFGGTSCLGSIDLSDALDFTIR